jgi:hypothetical protein
MYGTKRCTAMTMPLLSVISQADLPASVIYMPDGRVCEAMWVRDAGTAVW